VSYLRNTDIEKNISKSEDIVKPTHRECYTSKTKWRGWIRAMSRRLCFGKYDCSVRYRGLRLRQILNVGASPEFILRDNFFYPVVVRLLHAGRVKVISSLIWLTEIEIPGLHSFAAILLSCKWRFYNDEIVLLYFIGLVNWPGTVLYLTKYRSPVDLVVKHFPKLEACPGDAWVAHFSLLIFNCVFSSCHALPFAAKTSEYG